MRVWLLGCALVVMAHATPAFAQATQGVRLDEAWDDAIGGQEKILTEKGFAKLNNLAYQAAIAQVCKGYDLDQAKFSTEFAAATTAPSDRLSTDDLEQWKAAVLIRFGVVYGLFLAEGNASEAPFCAGAEDLTGNDGTKMPIVVKARPQ
jgi:hypothetical protein